MSNEELDDSQSCGPIFSRRRERFGPDVPVERHVEYQAGLPNSTGVWPVWIWHNDRPDAVRVVHWGPSQRSFLERFPIYIRAHQ